jgi:hypothetical protein
VSALAGALALAAVAGGGAAARPYNPDNLAADLAAHVGQVCQSIIRVQPGEEHYDSCVESLSDSLQSSGAGRAVSQARGDCLAKGFAQGSSALAVCELQSTGAPPAEPGDDTLVAANEPGGAKSYFSASPHDSFRREQLACAELGFDPAGGAFGSCVADLQAALFSADNPMN